MIESHPLDNINSIDTFSHLVHKGICSDLGGVLGFGEVSVSLNDFPALCVLLTYFILPCTVSVGLLRISSAYYILLQWQDSYCAQGLYHILMEQGYELRAQGIYTAAIKSLFEMTSLAE